MEKVILSKSITEKYSALSINVFSTWVKGEGYAIPFTLSWNHGIGIKYLSLVSLSNSKVLGETAKEIFMQHTSKDGRGVVPWRRIYEKISVPKVYFCGEQSLKGCEQAPDFISKINNVSFDGANHWIQNEPSLFYKEVENFIYYAREL